MQLEKASLIIGVLREPEGRSFEATVPKKLQKWI